MNPHDQDMYRQLDGKCVSVTVSINLGTWNLHPALHMPEPLSMTYSGRGETIYERAEIVTYESGDFILHDSLFVNWSE
jgi:hypothetical protein